DLVDRGVGRIAAARGGVEQDLALDGAAQRFLQRAQSILTSAAATTFCHFSISARMRLANCSGVSPPASAALSFQIACILSTRSALSTSRYMLSPIRRGVPLMRHNPV